MTRTYSGPQNAYMLAQAQYDTLAAVFKARRNAELDMSLLDTEEGIDRYCELETALEFAVGSAQAYTVLLAAEKALLAWAHEQVKAHPQYLPHAATIEKVLHTKRLGVRTAVVELCLNLAA